MNIREYQMHSSTHSLSLPEGAKFLGARWAQGWPTLFFCHKDDWTRMERWDLIYAKCDSSPVQVAGGDATQFEFLLHVPAVGTWPDLFLYRKIA